jgi:hypothetical protein
MLRAAHCCSGGPSVYARLEVTFLLNRYKSNAGVHGDSPNSDKDHCLEL